MMSVDNKITSIEELTGEITKDFCGEDENTMKIHPRRELNLLVEDTTSRVKSWLRRQKKDDCGEDG